MSDSNDYTVGWICALPVEYVAAQTFLDEKHNRPKAVSHNDNNDYTLGKIGDHNVVIAVLPSGEYGISSATSVARDMLHSFPNIRIGLMVGIGGGAPSQKNDIRLGDIVVSVPNNGESSVFQYDFGKTIQAQSFQPTGFLNQPPMVLRTAVSGLRTQYEMEGHQIEAAIEKALQSYPRLRTKYQRQNPATDKLYKPDFVHASDAKDGCEIICGSDPTNLITRRDRARDDDNPMIHYGLIASANNLMKDASVRDTLAATKDVLCFEMEASGLMNQFPCLVIRGICDYSDSHKNKEWQGYAAMAAAAYAKDLLGRIAPNKVEAERQIADIISSVRDQLSKNNGHVEEIKSKLNEHGDLEILDWLTPFNYGSQQSDNINRRQAGTGQWLIESPEFQSWQVDSKQTLFCPGIPGAGKTILTSLVVEHLTSQHQDDLDIGIAYIYCNFRQRDQQNAYHLLASLLKQLSRKRPSLPDSVEDLYDHHKKTHTRPSFDEIIITLHSVASLYSRVFIIVDALDECQVSDGCRNRFLSQTFSLKAKTKTSLFATSRPIPEIIAKFNDCTQLNIRAREEDVLKYVANQCSELPNCVQGNPKLEEEIKLKISQAVDGMFLLAKLHLDSLKGKKTSKAIRKALKNLPKGSDAYDVAYNDAMIRIAGQLQEEKELAMQVISWITNSMRPLTTSELQHALAVETETSRLDPENICPAEDMISVCAGLVTFDEKSKVIRLVHYTTQQYFDRTKKTWFPDVHVDMTKICATYLSFDDFKSGPCQNDAGFEERIQSNKLYDYASNYWGDHARKAAFIIPEVATFLARKAHARASSQALFVQRFTWNHSYSQEFPNYTTGLHLAAHFGVHNCLKAVLESNKWDSEDSWGRTPLSLAARNGHEGVVKMLLETESVDVDSKDPKYGRTPLSWAAENGHEGVVKILLETEKVDVDSKDYEYGRTPLSWAALKGHEGIVKMLLETEKVDVDSKDYEYGRTPLSWAALNGHKGIGKMLLETEKVDVDSKDSEYGRPPLSWAAEEGHEGIVKMLLETEKVDVDSKDSKYGLTPLSRAAEKGHEGVVKVLLETQARDGRQSANRY